MPVKRLADLVMAEAAREEVKREFPTSPVEPRVRHESSEEGLMAGPKYLRLLRKETRLREDQYVELTRLARGFNHRKSGGERITENTLIRVAIDLLLERKGELAGSTEEELQESVR